MKTNIYTLLAIGVIFLIHFNLINPLEKCIIFGLTDNNIIRRPQEKCIDASSFECLGMPSGHSETVVIISLLLFKLKLLSIQSCIVIIGLVGFERIFSSNHTLLQVIAGWSIGLVYAFIYLYVNKNNSYILLPVLSLVITLLLSALLTFIINQNIVNTPIPEWVNSDLLPIIHKKQNVPITNKFIYSITPIFLHNFAPFYSWNRLEHVLDKLYDKIISQQPNIDIIVGIKSGGAIIASYIHTKMKNKPLYFFKSKRNNKKESTNIFKDLYEKGIENKRYEMSVVEGINDNISNKNVLLLDETIESGQSIVFAKDYLIKNKQVASVTIATININNNYVKSVFDINDIIYYSKTENVTIFPWGYDN